MKKILVITVCLLFILPPFVGAQRLIFQKYEWISHCNLDGDSDDEYRWKMWINDNKWGGTNKQSGNGGTYGPYTMSASDASAFGLNALPLPDYKMTFHLHSWEEDCGDDNEDNTCDFDDDDGGNNGTDRKSPLQGELKIEDFTPLTDQVQSFGNSNWEVKYYFQWEPTQFTSITTSFTGYACGGSVVRFQANRSAFLQDISSALLQPKYQLQYNWVVNEITYTPNPFYPFIEPAFFISYSPIVETVTSSNVYDLTVPNINGKRKLAITCYPHIKGKKCVPTNEFIGGYSVPYLYFDVAPPAPTSVTIVPAHLGCFGDNSGSFTVTNVSSPYFSSGFYIGYRSRRDSINGGSFRYGGTSRTNLAADTFQLKILNPDSAGGCALHTKVVLTQPDKLFATTRQDSVRSYLGDITSSYTGKYNISCKNAADGRITFATNGGTPPYTYYLRTDTQLTTNAQTPVTKAGHGHTFDNLSPGTYYIQASDAHACLSINTTSASGISLVEPTAVSTTYQKRFYPEAEPVLDYHIRCHGNADGKLTFSASGGVGPYVYKLIYKLDTTSQASNEFDNLSAGNYAFEIKDVNNCTYDSSTVLNEPPALSIQYSHPVDPLCTEANNGTIELQGSGGVWQRNYAYTISGTVTANGRTAPATQTDSVKNIASSAVYTFSGLYASNMQYWIKDVNNCWYNNAFTLRQPDIISITKKTGHVTCHDSEDGNLIPVINGGTAPYTYEWYDASEENVLGTTLGISNLAAGTYVLYVTDVYQCNNNNPGRIRKKGLREPFDVMAPAPLTVGIDQITPVACSGQGNGSITVFPFSGGWGGVQYAMDHSQINGGAEFTNLSTGTYTIYAKDTYGCIDSVAATVTGPAAIDFEVIYSGHVLCKGYNDGFFVMSASGGNFPYTFSYMYLPTNATISDTPLNTTLLASNLIAGNYKLSIEDSKGCGSPERGLIITEPAALDYSGVLVVEAHCGAADGAAFVTITGGTFPYRYSWNAGNSTATGISLTSSLTGVRSGSYTLAVLDTNNCPLTVTRSIDDKGGPTVTGTMLSPASCALSADGTAKAEIFSLKNTSFTYTWSRVIGLEPVHYTGGAAQDLSKGRYNAIVTDGDSCRGSDVIEITAPAPLQASLTPSDPACFNGATGTVSVSVSGGTAPYDYLWNDSLKQTTATATHLPAFVSSLPSKTYGVEINDSHLCSISGTATIHNPGQMVVKFKKDSSTICVGQAVVLDAQNQGAAYEWKKNGEPFSAERKIEIREDGIYTVKATSEKGCLAEAAYTLRTSVSLLKAVFLATDTMYVGDTLLLAEISKLPQTGEFSRPDSIKWSSNLPSFKIFQQQGKQQEQYYFIPNDTGRVSFEMTAYMGECTDKFVNGFNVYHKPSGEGGRKLGFQGIKHYKAWPNPTNGLTELVIALVEEQDISVSIANTVDLVPVELVKESGKSSYHLKFDLNGYLPGVYLVFITTPYSKKVFKMVKE